MVLKWKRACIFYLLQFREKVAHSVQIHTRVCDPITFERYGRDAAKDRNYVNNCYELVHNQMQEELNQLVIDTQKSS